MKTARKTKYRQTTRSMVLAILCLGLIWSAAAAQMPDFLKGKVTVIDTGGNLSARMKAAEKAFLKEGRGDRYITGYIFDSRLQLDYRGEISQPYAVTVKEDRIRIDWGKGTHSETTSTEKSEEPAGLLFLHNASGEVVSLRLIDLDNAYSFGDVPLYWLGRGETADSLETCKGLFKEGPDEVKRHLLMVISSHRGPRPLDFLEGVATGDLGTKLRREAVFWIGSTRDPESLSILKKIYRAESDEDVREHIVFAMSLGKDDSAAREIIAIARSDESPDVRKQAVFWLGQMATKESIGALKDMVKDDEDTEIKKQAIFALTQTGDKGAEDLLFDIAQNHKNPHLRKTAMFWLGEINSDRALELYEKILLKK